MGKVKKIKEILKPVQKIVRQQIIIRKAVKEHGKGAIKENE